MGRAVSYWTEFRKCGRCCERCPHGPYWFSRDADGKKHYHGLTDPRPYAQTDVDFPEDCKDVGKACIYLNVGLWMTHTRIQQTVREQAAAVNGWSRREKEVKRRIYRAYDAVCVWHGWTPWHEEEGET